MEHERARPRVAANSFVPDFAHAQWHVDLADTPGAGYHLVVVDVFSKRAEWIWTRTKNASDLIAAMLKAFDAMGARPETLYSDQERAFAGRAWEEFLEQQGIVHIFARSTHAAAAEANIRTIKSWTARESGGTTRDKIARVVQTYNADHVVRTTGLTPAEAADPDNQTAVAAALARAARHRLRDPPLAVGDAVRTAIKLQPGEKKAVPRFSDDVSTVRDTTLVPGVGRLYQVDGGLWQRRDLQKARARVASPPPPQTPTRPARSAPPPRVPSVRARRAPVRTDL